MNEFSYPPKWTYTVDEMEEAAEGEFGYFGSRPDGSAVPVAPARRVADGTLVIASEDACLRAIVYRHRLAGRAVRRAPGLYEFDGGRVLVRVVRD